MAINSQIAFNPQLWLLLAFRHLFMSVSQLMWQDRCVSSMQELTWSILVLDRLQLQLRQTQPLLCQAIRLLASLCFLAQLKSCASLLGRISVLVVLPRRST
jgi:hypothetical protein